MKKIMIIATALFLMAGYIASAQNMTQPHPYSVKQDQKQIMVMPVKSEMQDLMNSKICPMCNQKMEHNMPMEKYSMMVNKLPTMQQELSLNDKQMEQLSALHDDFKKQQVDFQSELETKQMKLQSLLNNMAPATQVEKQLKDCADTKIRMGVAAYETAGKMNAVLSKEQKEQLKDKMMQKGGMIHGSEGMMN